MAGEIGIFKADKKLNNREKSTVPKPSGNNKTISQITFKISKKSLTNS